MSSWPRATIGDVCTMFSGGTPSKRNPAYWRGPIPWVSAKDLKSDRISDAELHISQRACDESATKLAPVGSLLMLVRGMGLANGFPIGEVISPVAFNQDIRAIVPAAAIDSRFLLFALRHSLAYGETDVLSSAAHGTLKIDADVLRKVEFPLPSLPEQRRIVAILDEAFEAVAIAKSNAENNLKSSRDIFEFFLHGQLSRRGPDWIEQTLEDVAGIPSKLVDPRKPEYVDLPHIGAGNIESRSGGLVDVQTAGEEKLISGKYLFDERAVLYSKIRPYLMKVVRPDFGGLCSADIYPLVPKSGRVDRDYLYYLLLSPPFTEYAIKGSARAGMPKVNREHLFAYRSWMPPVPEQAQLAARLDALADATQELANAYASKLAALEELKESLLHQAFTGQLTSSKQAKSFSQPALKRTTTPEFAANVISLAYARHERRQRERTFGHVKAQKVLHIFEAISKIDLGRRPRREAAGPNDFPHMLKAEEWAKSQHFFEMVKRDEGYDFRKLSAFDAHLSRAHKALAPYLQQLESVIDLVIPMDTKQAEVFATVHAAWNNLLIDGKEITDDAIVSAAREDWHPDKLKIPEHMFRTAISQIRHKGLVPDGTAKYVGGQQRLL